MDTAVIGDKMASAAWMTRLFLLAVRKRGSYRLCHVMAATPGIAVVVSGDGAAPPERGSLGAETPVSCLNKRGSCCVEASSRPSGPQKDSIGLWPQPPHMETRALFSSHRGK
ncbi:unnamed protein product [Arctogadus glacialis]